MAINSGLDGLKKDVITNLSKDKLKKYIFYLSKRYYEVYIEGDEVSFNQVIEQLHGVIDEYRESYVNLLGFTFFCLYLNANVIMKKAKVNEEFDIISISNYDLLDDENIDEELSHDLRNIFNKERVRERYYEKRASEFVE